MPTVLGLPTVKAAIKSLPLVGPLFDILMPKRPPLTDDQFQDEMARRRERLHLTTNDVVIGCPLCLTPPPPPARVATGAAQP
jgi:hypothetical protein